MNSDPKDFIFFIVCLTNQGKLKEDYVRGRSISVAYEKFLDQFDLHGQVLDMKFCLYKVAEHE